MRRGFHKYSILADHKIFACGIFLMLGILLLAGCGSNPSTGSTTSAATATATQCARAANAFKTTIGTLASMNGATLTITSLQGSSVTVTYSSSTRFTREEAIQPASLKEGTTVTVAGTNANNTYTASRITVVSATGTFPRLNGTPGTGQFPRSGNNPCFNRGQFRDGQSGGTGTANFRGLVGTVSQVSGSTLTITDNTGANYSVALTAQTQIVQTSSATAAALKAGEALTVIGTPGSNGAITARSITILLKLPAKPATTS